MKLAPGQLDMIQMQLDKQQQKLPRIQATSTNQVNANHQGQEKELSFTVPLVHPNIFESMIPRKLVR